MIRSFRNGDLQKLWTHGKSLPFKMPVADEVIKLLDFIDGSASPRDVSFFGFRFDEWIEQDTVRFSVMITAHWLVSYGWSDGDANEVDFEWVN